MHIVQLANFYGPRSGGIRVSLQHLAAEYLRAGHRVTLVVPAERDTRYVEPTVDGGAWPRAVATVRSPFVPGLGGYRGVVNVPKVVKLLARLDPDVIELSDKTSLAMAAAQHRRRAGTPVVLISHERVDAVIASTISESDALRAGVWRYNQLLLDQCDAVVCASNFAADEFRLATPGQRRAIFRVPLGVDLDRFRPPACAPGPGPMRLVAVVRQSPEKDPWLIPAAVRSLVRRGVEVQATVYGDGPLLAAVKSATRHLPLSYPGFVADRAQLAREIGRAHVACAPGPNETFGLGALEVLACGTPLVVPERGALKELVTAACGRVTPSTGDDVAAALRDLMSGDVADRRRAARRRAEQFTWRAAAQRMLELHHDLCRPYPAVVAPTALAAGV